MNVVQCVSLNTHGVGYSGVSVKDNASKKSSPARPSSGKLYDASHARLMEGIGVPKGLKNKHEKNYLEM